MAHPSPSFSATVRVRLDDRPGAFAALAAAVGGADASLGAIDLVRVDQATKVRDVTVLAADESHLHKVVDAIRAVDGNEVLQVSDRTFLLHAGGSSRFAPPCRCGPATSCPWRTRLASRACLRRSRKTHPSSGR